MTLHPVGIVDCVRLGCGYPARVSIESVKGGDVQEQDILDFAAQYSRLDRSSYPQRPRRD